MGNLPQTAGCLTIFRPSSNHSAVRTVISTRFHWMAPWVRYLQSMHLIEVGWQPSGAYSLELGARNVKTTLGIIAS